MTEHQVIEISKSGSRMKIVSMHFQYRKKKCLAIYDIHNNSYVKVATFNNDYSADEFMEYLAKFCGIDHWETET